MRLAWIEVTDFRSYRALEYRPDPGLNVLVGANGVGKTNLLEAMSYLSRLKSFRRAPDEALIRDGADAAVMRGGFERASGEVRVEVELPRSGRRRVLLNGKRPRRHSDLLSEIPMVTFLPDDLDVVKRGPALRRDYVDDLAAQLLPSAGADLAEYERAVRQRNSLLRADGPHADAATLDVWDERVAATGGLVAGHRLRLLARLLPTVTAAYQRLSAGTTEIDARYQSRWAAGGTPLVPPGDLSDAELTAALATTLGERRRRDMEQRTTSAGPHRDDPTFLLRGDLHGSNDGARDARTQASQGEQRSLALSLRLAAYELLTELHGQPPILLLDDVFSELDPDRAAVVVELLPQGQVLVTSARHDEVPTAGTLWEVTPGAVDRARSDRETT